MTKKINLSTVGNFISIIKNQEIWHIDKLLENLNINYDELLYLLTILSDIYSKNGEYFFSSFCNKKSPVGNIPTKIKKIKPK